MNDTLLTELLTIKQTADFLGIDARAVRKLVLANEIPVKIIGKTKRIIKGGLLLWLQKPNYIASTKEKKSTTCAITSKHRMEEPYDCDKVLEQLMQKQQNAMQSANTTG